MIINLKLTVEEKQNIKYLYELFTNAPVILIKGTTMSGYARHNLIIALENLLLKHNIPQIDIDNSKYTFNFKTYEIELT